MYAISRARVCDCVSDVFIQPHFVRPSLRRRENIKVRERGSLFTRCSCLEIRERCGSILSYFVRVHVCVSFCVRDHGRVLGVLIQLAFKTLINCRGIWLFSVNAISHAECSVNGCLPTAGPAPTSSPLFSYLPLLFSPLLSSPLLSSCLIKGLLCFLSRNRHAWNNGTQLRCPGS